MILTPELHAHALDHARENSEVESCGLIVLVKGRRKYWPCRNLAGTSDQFILSPQDWAEAEDAGVVLAVVHSHPCGLPRPSAIDSMGIQSTGLPWIILSLDGEFTETPPLQPRPTVYGIEFEHGISDCYAFVRSYFFQELGVALPDFYREREWWLKGQDVIISNLSSSGFIEVPIKTLRVHDVLLTKLASPVVNHVAVFIGGNLLGHHVVNRLSSKDIYNDFWRYHTVSIVRHRSLL